MDFKTRLKEFKASMGPTVKELRFMISRFKKSPLSIIGTAIVIFYIAIALLAPVLAPPTGRDPYLIPRESYEPEPQPPSAKHPFGTAQRQYDIYYGCIWGTRMAFRVGVMVVGASLLISLFIGSIAGYYGGVIDELMMRFTDVIYAFPGLILAMALVVALPYRVPIDLGFWAFGLLGLCAFGLLGSRAFRLSGLRALGLGFVGFFAFALLHVWALGPLISWNLMQELTRLDKLMIALFLVGWPTYTRVIRGEILRVKEEDYVEAAKAVGCSDLRVIVRHVLPNSIYPILIMASLDIGSIVLTAAALSFLGLGAPMGYADWGQMISFSRNWIYVAGGSIVKYWYTWTIPGIFIFTFVLGWNLLGDAFRDVLDPMLRRR